MNTKKLAAMILVSAIAMVLAPSAIAGYGERIGGISRKTASENRFPNSISDDEAEKMPLRELEALYLRDRAESKASNDMLSPKENDLLSKAEQIVIQVYTRDDIIENARIFIAGVVKLPKKAGIYFRGSSKKDYQIKDTITLDRISSVSSDRRIAEAFTDPNGALLAIHARGARSIEGYSVVGFEKEFILLPGTKLRVDKISKADLHFTSPSRPNNSITVPFVQETELP